MRNEDRGKRLIAIFLLGLVLLNFPLLAVVETSTSWFGLPPLLVYLFGVWAVIIARRGVVGGRRRPR